MSQTLMATLTAGVFVAPFLVAKKDCELFIKWKGDAGGLNHIRGEKVRAAPLGCCHASGMRAL